MALNEVRRGPGLKNRNLSDTAGINLHKLALDDKFFYYDGKGRWNGCQSDGTVASEVDAEINYLTDGRGNSWEKYNINTQVSGFPFPNLGTSYVDLAVCNQTNAQGAEYVPGGNDNGSPVAFTVGTHAFFMKATITIADVSGADVHIGFRKVQAFQATFTDYTDYAAVMYDGTASTAAGTTKTATDNDNAGETLTNMSLATADGDVLTCEITVDLGGNVRYKFNGAQDSDAVAFAFDSTDVVVPFIRYINTADVAGAIHLRELVIGLSDANVR